MTTDTHRPISNNLNHEYLQQNSNPKISSFQLKCLTANLIRLNLEFFQVLIVLKKYKHF